MAAGQDFAAQITAFVAAAKERQAAVFHEATERVIEVMQTPVGAGGNMPVDTGFLRASLQVTKDSPTPAIRDNPGKVTATYNDGAVSLAIMGAEIGETLFACYGASYAAAVNYGRAGHTGRMFIQLAAQQWTQIVDKVCLELQTRIESSSGGDSPST